MRSKIESLTVVFYLCIVKILLKTLTLKQTLSVLQAHANLISKFRRRSLSPEEMNRLATKVEHFALHLPMDLACLPKSLTLLWCLRNRNQPATLFIGVDGDAGHLKHFSSHAWIETKGVTFWKSGPEFDGFNDIWRKEFPTT